nr:hypothetical protein [Tanacetum cinerariifolium]GFA21163.1 hypothetical protein [Tanacetum cinerariifolium]
MSKNRSATWLHSYAFESSLSNITIGVLGMEEVDTREALLSSITIGVLGLDEVNSCKAWLSNITIGVLGLVEVDAREAEDNTSAS